VGGAPGVNTFLDLIGSIVTSLAQAFSDTATTGR
jgi:hypothetical protein